MVQLGEGFQAPQIPAPDQFVAAIVGEVTTRVLATIQPQLADINRQISAALARPNQPIHVAPAQIPRSPDVKVAPVIDVHVPPIDLPAMPPMSCTVEMPGIERLASVLENLYALLQRPVEKSVRRDNGFISTVTERRV